LRAGTMPGIHAYSNGPRRLKKSLGISPTVSHCSNGSKQNRAHFLPLPNGCHPFSEERWMPAQSFRFILLLSPIQGPYIQFDNVTDEYIGSQNYHFSKLMSSTIFGNLPAVHIQ
jgi:hypothetical protein